MIPSFINNSNIGASASGTGFNNIGPHAGFYSIGFEFVGGSLPSATSTCIYWFAHTAFFYTIMGAKIKKNARRTNPSSIFTPNTKPKTLNNKLY